jgi:hypothetical protein
MNEYLGIAFPKGGKIGATDINLWENTCKKKI